MSRYFKIKTGLLSEALFLSRLEEMGLEYGFKVISNPLLDRRGIDAILRFKSGEEVSIQIKEEVSALLGKENRSWLIEKYQRNKVDYIVCLQEAGELLAQLREYKEDLSEDEEEWLLDHLEYKSHFLKLLREIASS